MKKRRSAFSWADFRLSVLIEVATMSENVFFLLNHELNIITRTFKVTYVRLDLRGFHRRIRITARKTVSSKYEIRKWVRDAVGRVPRNRAGGRD
ncbi:hypothetical protein GGQ85_003102 [Nitrobacter vulgaris]|jgi:hypothetical protein|uniref:hypothetical protein n=1 Tax=Nitrobacter vulgaris TaxID=29421 RepID=UPI002859B0E6|nr:hypothetical protein [Nitrobacter vulgaris]MDR6305380.1 hypothetical protein [Nitrobacter vulgaris]